MGLKIQANGPKKAQSNAILEKVFTAITKVVHVRALLRTLVYSDKMTWPFGPCVASIQMRRGWKACPSSWIGMWGPYSAGSGSAATRRSPALWLGSAKACKANPVFLLRTETTFSACKHWLWAQQLSQPLWFLLYCCPTSCQLMVWRVI